MLYESSGMKKRWRRKKQTRLKVHFFVQCKSVKRNKMKKIDKAKTKTKLEK